MLVWFLLLSHVNRYQLCFPNFLTIKYCRAVYFPTQKFIADLGERNMEVSP